MVALVAPPKFAVNVTTASTEVLASNPNRRYAVIINDSSEVMWLAFGEDAVANSGIRLNAGGGSFEMGHAFGNLTQAAVNAIHAGSGNKVCCGVEV